MKPVVYNVWFIISCILSLSSIHAGRLSICKNLEKLMHNLKRGMYSRAILCSPHVTHTAPIAEAAQQGTQITLISRGQQCPKELVHLGIHYRHANLHDKLFLTQTDNGQWSAHLGSANFTRNHWNNSELVLHTQDPLQIPGLAQHVHKLICCGMIPDNFIYSHDIIDDNYSELMSAQNEHICPNDTSLFSSFETDLVEHIAHHILTDHKTRRYSISSMTLNHPLLIQKIITVAALCDGQVRIIVDKKWATKKMQSVNAFSDLVMKAQQSNGRIQVHSTHGVTATGLHHAKLFIRESVNQHVNQHDSDGVSIVSSANMTQQARQQTNNALAMPHNTTKQDIIDRLKKYFITWWKRSKPIAA